MSHVFAIDTSFIKAVDDETARELVARLCRAELRARGLPESAVTWGGDQRAKDGGVDVRVDCPISFLATDYVRSLQTVYQVKAEKFTPAKIRKEMAPNGTLRPALRELIKTGGTYIIVSSRDDVSDEALQSRRRAMSGCLTGHGLGANVQVDSQVDFYDSRRIADWVEQHPSIGVWLRHRISRPLTGWRPYGPWAYREDNAEAEYLVDDRMKVFLPNTDERIRVTDAISQLRRELQRPVSIRIVGLSGVGKTRLVQALFDPRVCPGSTTPTPESVIYADLADEPDPRPQAMLESLHQNASDLTVIVDNCSPDTHGRLSEVVARKDSRLRLITIEYDIRDDLPEGTYCYRLEGASREVITKLVKGRFPCLSHSDAGRIAEFSDGNARVALALASTVEEGGELSRLRSRDLFDRLFHQKNQPNDDLLRCAEAASLLYSFDGLDVSATGEIARLASFVEVTPQTFSRHMAELKRRGLLQERSRWRAVMPQAIANELATRMLQSVPADLLYDALIEQAGDRVARSFSRRLGFLHECNWAVEMASRMFSENGKLGDLTVLTDFEQQMFENLAPLDQRGALEAIGRATGNEGLLSSRSHDLVRFAHVARSIAYEPEYFDDAAVILTKLALTDNVEKQVRDALTSLFYCHLSGTQASPEQRQRVVKGLLSSNDEKARELGFDLLKAGLEASYFSSICWFEFGARHRDFGWYPRTWNDVKAWYKPWIEMLAAAGEHDSVDGRTARAMLARAWSSLWGGLDLDDELSDAAKRMSAIDGWPEGWRAVRETLQPDARPLSSASRGRLRLLEKALAPSDLTSEIRARVLTGEPFACGFDGEDEIDEEGGSPPSTSERVKRALPKVEALGARACSSSQSWEALIPDLCSKSVNTGVYAFGRGVGRQHRDMAALLEAVRTHFKSSNPGDLSLMWVSGLLAGWREVDADAIEAFLDNAIDDVVWAHWLVALQLVSPLDDRAFDRLVRSLDLGRCPASQFACMARGRATDPLSVVQIMAISSRLALRPDRGLPTAVDLLAMVVHCTDEKDEEYKRELAGALFSFLNDIDWSALNADDVDEDYKVGVIVEFALQSSASEEQVAPILRRMLSADETESIVSYKDVRKTAVRSFFKYFPRLALELVCLPDKDGTFKQAWHLVSPQYWERDDMALALVPTEVLIDWCNEKPETRYLFAAQVCDLFVKRDEETPLAISDTATRLLASASDKVAVLTEFARRLWPRQWSGSRADIVEARLPLLGQLDTGGDDDLRSQIEAAKASLQKEINEQREREKEWGTENDPSFE